MGAGMVVVAQVSTRRKQKAEEETLETIDAWKHVYNYADLAVHLHNL